MTDSRSGLALDELSAEIRPQDDLFRHVNGAWLDRTEIPDDKARWGSFHLIAEQAEKDVHAIVEETRDAEPGTESRKIGDLYASFMDTERIAELGASPLHDQLARADAIDSIPALLRTLGELERDGIGGLIGLYVEPDPGNPQRYVPFLVQGGLSLPDESYYRLENFDALRTAYRGHIERLLDLAEVPDAAAAADRIFALETEVATHHWDNVRSRDAVATYNLMTWDDVTALAGIDLRPWLEGTAPGREEAFAEANVYQPSFFEGLGSLLWRSGSRTGRRGCAGASCTVPPRSCRTRSSTRTSRSTARSSPVCRSTASGGSAASGLAEAALGEAIGRVYVERHFPPSAKVAMDELVANLIEAYRQSITSLEWMTAETRERALAKLDAFTPKIGYPVKWRDYSALEIDAGDLVGNVRRAHIHEHDRQIGRIGGEVDRDEWYMTPQTVNAYYNPLMNEIVFPAAILQHPFFEADRDAAANYGGIGAVIGHEIGHGFDDQGSRFDGDGSLRDWWTDADRAAFEERTSVLIEQFNALVPRGLPGGEQGQRGAHDRREHRRPRRARHRDQGVRAVA